MLREYFRSKPDISAVYLFGSFARGRQGHKSDLDLAILFSPEELTKMQRFERRIDLELGIEKLTERNVDVIDLVTAPPVLQHQVRKHGLLLLEKDHRHRVSFEVTTRRNYFDLTRVYHQRNQNILFYSNTEICRIKVSKSPNSFSAISYTRSGVTS